MRSIIFATACLGLLALISCGGGGGGGGSGTTSDEGSSGPQPVSGAISGEPWQGTWSLYTAGGADASGAGIQITYSLTGAFRQNAYVGTDYIRLWNADCSLTFSGVSVYSNQTPDTDASQATVNFYFDGHPTAEGCSCDYANLQFFHNYPSSGGISQTVSSGLDSSMCAAAPLFADGFESGDVSVWSQVP